jgi:hypothetical protein
MLLKMTSYYTSEKVIEGLNREDRVKFQATK